MTNYIFKVIVTKEDLEFFMTVLKEEMLIYECRKEEED